MILTKKERSLLRQVKKGADIYGLEAATFFRKAEKEGLIEITAAQANIPGEKQQPYFGCILTAKGRGVVVDGLYCHQCGNTDIVYEGPAEGYSCPKCGSSDSDE